MGEGNRHGGLVGISWVGGREAGQTFLLRFLNCVCEGGKPSLPLGLCEGATGRERCKTTGGGGGAGRQAGREKLSIIRDVGDAHGGSWKIKLSIISADPIAMVTGQRKILIKPSLFC